jgi:hypothetical protein
MGLHPLVHQALLLGLLLPAEAPLMRLQQKLWLLPGRQCLLLPGQLLLLLLRLLLLRLQPHQQLLLLQHLQDMHIRGGDHPKQGADHSVVTPTHQHQIYIMPVGLWLT